MQLARHIREPRRAPKPSSRGFETDCEKRGLDVDRPKFLSGLRQFKSATLTMDDPREMRFTKALSELLITKSTDSVISIPWPSLKPAF
jgi:hypothetical protein